MIKPSFNQDLYLNILRAVEMMVENSDFEGADSILKNIYLHLFGKEKAFSIDVIILRYFVRAALDSEYRSSREMLTDLHKQLTGSLLYTNTYAIKHDFREWFKQEEKVLLDQVNQLIDVMDQPVITEIEKFEQLQEDILNYTLNCEPAEQIHQLLLHLATTHLISLNHPNATSYHGSFDAEEQMFSLILPSNSMTDLYPRHLTHVKKFVEQLSGTQIIYATVINTKVGFFINIY